MGSFKNMLWKNINFALFFYLIVFSFISCSIHEPKGDLNGYSSDVYSIISSRCFGCHAGGNAEGDLGVIDNANSLISRGYITPGSASGSTLYLKTIAPEFGARMPYGGPYLTDGEIASIANWINGLSTTGYSCIPHIVGGSPSFSTDVRPLLESRLPQNTSGNACIGCHKVGGSGATKWLASTNGGVSTSYANVTGASVGLVPYAGALVVAGDPCNSRLYMRISQTSGPDSPWNQMPKSATNKMTSAQLGIIYTWILNGAPNN